MLPKHLDDLLCERLRTELLWYTQNIERSRTRAVEKAHSLGNDPRSLVTMELVSELGDHIKKIYEAICDVIGQVGFDPYEEFPNDLVAIFDTFSDEQVAHIQSSLDSWHGKPHNPQIDKYNDLHSTFANIKENYRVKIKTLALSVLHPVAPYQMTEINIENSTVGSVSTGDGNVINVAIEAEIKRDLIKELDAVSDAVNSIEELDDKELIPVIEETKEELEAEQPNRLKLRGLLTSVASTIKGIGTLNKSYKTIAAVLETFGVSIPN